MPGRRAAAQIDPALCRRCQVEEPAITVRTEPLCSACFCRYVSTKVVKRLESFRVRHSDPGKERVLLLPLSFGACSVALLYILSEHLKGQVERTGRTGFKLHVLYVDDGTLPSNVTAESLLGNIKLRFPEHSYTISSLSDITSPDDITALLSHNNNTLDAAPPAATEAQPTLENILSSVKSATSRADILQLLRRRFIVQFAKSHACESILWADSTTRLAERTLAETAKGRGLSLPWIVADGVSPYGIQFYFPMRELLSKEISAYASLAKPPLDDLALQDELKPVVSTKSTSIDDLMKQYFESVERDYPSIVANVVRTTGKLRTPNFSQAEMHCELCEMPLDNASPERSRLCYGCIRMLPAADVR